MNTAGSTRVYVRWTAEEDRILRDNYDKLSIAELADLLPRRVGEAIRSRLHHKKIRKTESRRYHYREGLIRKTNRQKAPPRLILSTYTPKESKPYDKTPCSERDLGYVR